MITEIVPLGTHVRVVGGFAFPSESYSDEGVPVIRISDIQDGLVSAKNAAKVPEEMAGKGWNYQVEPGDILIAMSGATTGKIGVVADDFDGPFLQNQRVGKFSIADSEKVDKVYLRHYLTSPSYQKQLRNLMAGAAQPNISSKQLESIDFPLPSLTEQKRIAAILDNADSIRRKRQVAVRLTEELLRSVFLDMFGDPESNKWPMTTISGVAQPGNGSIRTGPFGSQLLHSEFVDEGIAVLGIDNAVANEFLWSERRFISKDKYRELSRYTVRSGDVIITIMGTCGRCAIVPEDIPVAINTKHLCCITLDHTKCLPTFVHAYFLQHRIARRYLNKTAKGAIMDGLNMSIIKDMPIPIPPLNLQQKFERSIATIEKLRNTHRLALAEQSTLFNSLLQRAFTGML